MTRQRICIRSLLADLFFFVLFQNPIALLLCALGGGGVAWGSLLLVFPSLLMWWIRRRSRRLSLFLLGHAGLILCPWLLPLSRSVRLCGVMFLLCFAVYSFRRRLGGEPVLEAVHLCLGTAWLVGLNVAGTYFGLSVARSLPPLGVLILFLCYLAYAQTSRLDESLLVLTSNTRQPVESILRFNNRNLLLLLLLSCAAAGLSRFFPMEAAVRGLGRGIAALLRFLLGLIPTADPLPDPTPAPSGAGGMGFALQEAGEPSRLLQILEQIVVYAVNIAFLLGGAALLLYGAYRIYRRFYAEGLDEGGDRREFLSSSEEKQTEKGRRRMGGLGKRFFSDERARIRRQYARRVRRHIRQGVPVRPADTPKEIGHRIGARDEMEKLTERYERARYGPWS